MRRGAWLAVGLLWLAACGRPADLPAPDEVARLGGAPVRLGDFDEHLRSQLGTGIEALRSPALSALFDQFVEERLLVALARARGVAGPEDPPRQAIDALLAADGPLLPSAAEVEAHYRAHVGELGRPDRVRLWQLLASNREVAERARRELVAGERREAVVARARRAGGSVQADDQGELAREDLPPAFAGIVFSLSPGGVSPVVEADYGFHVFVVEARLPARTPTLEEVRPRLERELGGRRADERLASLLRAARERFPVTVYDRNLPFEYQGMLPVSRPYEENR